MLPKPELTYFAVADISGYRIFVAGVEPRPRPNDIGASAARDLDEKIVGSSHRTE
jgi:hypothetical protein